MLPIFYKVVHQVCLLGLVHKHLIKQFIVQLHDAISAQVKDGAREVDVLNWMGRAALELIGQGGLGYSFDPLVEDVSDEYGDAMKAYL